MNTDKIKNKIKNMVGMNVSLKVNLGRNKHETYEGVINNIYPAVFTVKCDNITRSFSYNDVLTKDVKISII